MARRIRFPGQPVSDKNDSSENSQETATGNVNQLANSISNQLQREIPEIRYTESEQFRMERQFSSVPSNELPIMMMALVGTFILILVTIILSGTLQNNITVPVYCKAHNSEGECTAYLQKPYNAVITAKELQMRKPLSFYTTVECSVRYYHNSTEYNIPIQCQKTNNSITATIIPDSRYINYSDVALHIRLIKNGSPSVVKTLNVPLEFDIKEVK